ncbi:fimbrial chaperone [Providencia rustigianii]|uniref:Gram-negative pili assembly chaperone domain protein n=1 Tax=Providencia rustigianii DSM 4541 TaxID=500637 RepID=D1P766_9GAMM|nr:fimbrial chaperone [Providencia rustigianii]EFB70913.1 gram-negative pili assembly chaperone domain protein [Providencia rustigianii DSM 4541]SUC25516.1 Chaperone protein faeE precursor [Providencia rustigianii]
MNKILSIIFLCICSSFANAAFTLDSTRYIYDEGQQSVSVTINNDSGHKYGGQVWIDNINKNDEQVFFSPSPMVFKLNPKQSQIVRIVNINDDLPKDRESLFWLNVQEIPPAAKGEGSSLSLAINSRVKLIYRPAVLKNGRDDAENSIKIINSGADTYLQNTTPYYFAISEVKVNGKLIALDGDVKDKLGKFAPFSKVSLGKINSSDKISITAFNDYGVATNYNLTRSK